MNRDIQAFNDALSSENRAICHQLATLIHQHLPGAEEKIWHAHPVWFIDGNPIVGYSKLKDCIRLMFWSGASFGEEALKPGTGKFKDASIRYTDAAQINESDIKRWLIKAAEMQWDYKNLIKRKGQLKPIKGVA